MESDQVMKSNMVNKAKKTMLVLIASLMVLCAFSMSASAYTKGGMRFDTVLASYDHYSGMSPYIEWDQSQEYKVIPYPAADTLIRLSDTVTENPWWSQILSGCIIYHHVCNYRVL